MDGEMDSHVDCVHDPAQDHLDSVLVAVALACFLRVTGLRQKGRGHEGHVEEDVADHVEECSLHPG